MKKTATLLLCLLVFSFLEAAGQTERKPVFRILDTENGLPENNVRNVIMLPNGLVCIQTPTVLNLYNGATCESFRFDPSRVPYSEYAGMNRTQYDALENSLWCSSASRHWIFNLDTHEFDYDIGTWLAGYGITGEEIDQIFFTEKGNCYFTTPGNTFHICDRQNKSVLSLNLPRQMSGPVVFRKDGEFLWLLSREGMLARFDLSLNSFVSVQELDSQFFRGESASRIDFRIAQDGTVWIITDKKLLHLDPRTGRLQPFEELHLDDKNLFTALEIDQENRLWIGTARSGLTILDLSTGAWNTLPVIESISGRKIYPHSDISHIYADTRGGVWIATEAEGIAYWNRDIIRLDNINATTLPTERFPDESIKCLLEDSDRTILAGTVKGLFRYNPLTGKVTIPFRDLSDKLCISLYRDSDGRIWVGTFYNGIYCIDQGKIVRHFQYPGTATIEQSYQQSIPNPNCVRALRETTDGQFWISVYGGVGRFDPTTGAVSLLQDSHPEVKSYMMVRDIFQTSDTEIAVCGDNGSYLYNFVRDATSALPYQGKRYQFFKDSRGLTWSAQDDGLFVSCQEENVSGENIVSITEDRFGNIWAASFNHILRIRIHTEQDGAHTFSVTTYNRADGIEAGVFSPNAVLADRSGRIWFGGSGGICLVEPNAMFFRNEDITPYIAGVEADGKRMEFTEGKPVHLRYDERSISVFFTNLNYANPTHSSYRYRLDHFDKEWKEINSTALGTAHYSFLPAGDYTLRIQGAFNGTDWSTDAAEVRFIIHPPFWKSKTATRLYFALGLLLIAGFSFYLQKREKKKRIERAREEQRRQQEELDQMKFRFFTNISHELRTPLSLILLPLEKLIKEENRPEYRTTLLTMRDNATDLLSLVNHLLDFRRLEMGGEKLHLAKGDIGEFVINTLDYFRPALSRKGIRLGFTNNLDGKVIMAYDSSQMQKILNNLLSNAMKFTPEGGSVDVEMGHAGRERIYMEISDSGIGIPEEDLRKIFDRFFRSRISDTRPGTGIGLSLVKQYVDMHSGTVTVSSEIGRGTTFRIELPTDLQTEENAGEESRSAPVIPPNPERQDEEPAQQRPRILLVDDNDEFRKYLAEELSGTYDVDTASDGKDCLERISSILPDIVVCDVMMPQMDGFEVTKALKGNIETSHIPVILLTARASDDFRLEGYENGADAYLTKPFKIEILEARIRNLLEERQKRIKSFSRQAEISPMHITITTIDQKLMAKIMESIERNMDNPDYSVEILASDVSMHRMNLYRKLQSLTGMTPSEFIRTMRLKRATQLLTDDPNLNVSEVATMVGFNTVKYFTKYFKEMFGTTPSQYKPPQNE